jgi:hypothetical protein
MVQPVAWLLTRTARVVGEHKAALRNLAQGCGRSPIPTVSIYHKRRKLSSIYICLYESEMSIKILASRAVSVRNQRGVCNVVILDGDGIHKASVGDVFTVGPDGTGVKACARLKLASAGWFPMARVERLQTGVPLKSLVGMEAVKR